ncbi:glycosyltransferase [Winogradskyella sp.]|uniref:glycosyltransferase n=1 Tax=Winogradskyella sp. TaxID=1883156 RepID=UPI0025FF0C40|nr:glycosyltransferase [Winogradskyella sp.]MCT4628402.1 glycosyltransferase [Winogradskyella sp.]
MKLTIISHTEHYKLEDGTIVGWGPTITEINFLSQIFDEIYHVAMFHDVKAPESSLPYTSNKIKFVPIKPSGGHSVLDKIKVALSAPTVVKMVNSVLKKSDCFQLRTPTGIGVFLIPYLTLFSKKKGWYKYAGNWSQESPPLGYALQRFMLKHQSRKVTINGHWQNQKKHCLTFENPCLTDSDLKEGIQVRSTKNNNGLINFCYAGRLEREKGVERIIKAFNSLDDTMSNKVGQVHLIGNGSEIEYFKSLTVTSKINFVFHGFLPTDKLFQIYKASHFFLMPTTASEGFPKVIAEAMNFGCLPIVSNISSIGQYVTEEVNGFLIQPVNENQVKNNIEKALLMPNEKYRSFVFNCKLIVKKFSYPYYVDRIKKLVE